MKEKEIREETSQRDGDQSGSGNPPDATNHEGGPSTPSDASIGYKSSSYEESYSREDNAPPKVVLVVPGKGKIISVIGDTSKTSICKPSCPNSYQSAQRIRLLPRTGGPCRGGGGVSTSPTLNQWDRGL